MENRNVKCPNSGGIVQNSCELFSTLINEKQPTNITKDHCDWKYFIFIIFNGNDDMMWAKRYEIAEEKRNKETVKALELISGIPLPVTKAYLKTIGFEDEP